MLQWARKYLKLNLSIIPLSPRGKSPLIPWTEFQKRKANEQEIREWLKKWPDMNLGIVMGAISGVVVVDLDGPEGLKESIRLSLHSSVISLTGNGKHLWYQCLKETVSNAVKLYPGLDIRGESGYVVVPPSIHENGKRYRFITVLTDVAKLPLFPKDLIIPQQTNIGNGLNLIKKEDGWIAKALEEMKDGNIDTTITSILGRMRRDGYSPSDAKILLQPHMERVNAEHGHLEAKIENIWNRYESYKPGIQNEMRLHQSNGQSCLLPAISIYGSENQGLVIHSPTNPDSIKQFELQVSRTESEPRLSLKTGYSRLDGMLTAGLKSSRLFTIAARTGTGKTNWILGCAKHLCESGKKVLLFSTEMPYTEIWARYKACLRDSESFERHQFYVCDSFTPSLEKVEEAINTIKPDVFIFDHINHVSEEHLELGTFIQGLNWLKRKYDCAGIVTAQLNRSADWIELKTGKKVEPRMSMIKGSGTIEQASSRILLLSETRVTPECTEIVGVLDKNDNGTKGLVNFGLFSNPWRIEEI